MFEARIAELNRFNEQNPVSYDKRTYTSMRFRTFWVSVVLQHISGKTRCIPQRRVGGHIRISKKSFDDWLDHADE